MSTKIKKGFFMVFLGGFFIFYGFSCVGLLALLFHFPDFVWDLLRLVSHPALGAV